MELPIDAAPLAAAMALLDLTISSNNNTPPLPPSKSYAAILSQSLPLLLPLPLPSLPREGGRTAVYLTTTSLEHQFIRNELDRIYIVERPERIKAVVLGVVNAWTFLEGRSKVILGDELGKGDSLSGMMSRLELGQEKKGGIVGKGAFDILISNTKMEIDSPALQYIHSNLASSLPPSSSYLAQIVTRARDSPSLILIPPLYSEIPETLSQGDLYLSPGSESAILGSVGTVCQAVEEVCGGIYETAFVVVRPPGHHCGENEPAGFCWVNNVLVGAAQAHLRKSISRVVIFDIDLHHGDGSQSIVWRINNATKNFNQTRFSPRKMSPNKIPPPPGLQICYTSLHDVASYPCEDGNLDKIQAASVMIKGGNHGQFIANVHLEKWATEQEFYEILYPRYWSGLEGAARAFCERTVEGADQEGRTLVFISAGFDASEHEGIMSRHSVNVPTSFYTRIARDIKSFADQFARGKLIAVLEGGYSDKALETGSEALMIGLCPPAEGVIGSKERKKQVLDFINFGKEEVKLVKKVVMGVTQGNTTLVTEGRGMQLRERRPKVDHLDDSPAPSPRLKSRAKPTPSVQVVKEVVAVVVKQEIVPPVPVIVHQESVVVVKEEVKVESETVVPPRGTVKFVWAQGDVV